MYGYEHFGAGWGMLLFWLVPIVLLVLVVRYLLGDKAGKAEPTPLDILKTRYAKGEIDEEEYQRKKRELGG